MGALRRANCARPLDSIGARTHEEKNAETSIGKLIPFTDFLAETSYEENKQRQQQLLF